MSDYAAHLSAARRAQRKLRETRERLRGLQDARDKALAAAWACRPGGMEWADVVAAFNSGMPAGSALSTSALRAAEREHRSEVADG